jgi:hypothetical protein
MTLIIFYDNLMNIFIPIDKKISTKVLSTPNIGLIANVHHAWLDECTICVMRKKFKCRRGCGGAYGGVWQSLYMTEVWSQVVGFMSVHAAGVWLVAMEMFSHLI